MKQNKLKLELGNSWLVISHWTRLDMTEENGTTHDTQVT